MTTTQVESLLRPDCVRLDAAVTDKRQAIALLGQLLAAGGCTDERYGHSMAQREALADTFLGAGVAIPHGRVEDRHLVRRDGLAVLQIPGGIEWNPGQRVRLVVGIAARSDGHIAILKRLTGLIQDEARLRQLAATHDPQDIIAALTAAAPKTAAAAEPATDLEHSLEWIVSYPSGLHARPASTWAQAAQASGLPIRVRHGADSADARSLVDLLQLGLTAKARVVFSASGSEAPAALAKFLAVVNGLTAQERSAAQAQAPSAAPGRTWQPVTALAAVTGVAASAGLAVGRVRRLASADAQVPDRPAPLLNGKALLEAALAAARQETQALADATAKRLGAADAAIFQAQAGLLDDVGLITDTCQLMAAGHGAAWAWHEAVQAQAERLSALGNPMLAARAADLRDVGLRALRHMEPSLAGDSEQAATHGDPVVLIAADLAPSDTAALDIRRVAGLATTLGGPTSHTAILARTLGLPAIVAAGAELLDLVDGAQVIIDGDAGRIHLSPTEADLDSARAWIAQAEAARQAAAAERQLPANTRDGHAVAIGANIIRAEQVASALEQGAEGVGLMRTEFLFLERHDTPGEDEQFHAYRGMLDALADRPLIVRTLDIGGDKQVPHLGLPVEENPFLGVRGARLLLRRPDLLEPQLRALYRAAAQGGDLSIMFPMVTSLAELLQLKDACERVRAELAAPSIALGVMIEVPAAALLADAFAEHADFFSIGTNDLTQYTLAIDRQNPALASEADSLHPAVLRLIAQTVQGARTHGRWVGVCGDLAGDPFGAALLTGLGVAELSMAPRAIAPVKARLRRSALPELQALAAHAQTLTSAQAVRALDGDMA